MIVLDTHALIWWVNRSPELSARALREIRKAQAESAVVVSAISALEISTAVRRGRLDLQLPVDRWLGDAQKVAGVRFQPVTAEAAQLAGSFSDPAPRDPIDRIIAATAITLRSRLVTADSQLQAFSLVQTIW